MIKLYSLIVIGFCSLWPFQVQAENEFVLDETISKDLSFEFEDIFEEDEALWERYLLRHGSSVGPDEECLLELDIDCNLSDGTACESVHLVPVQQCVVDVDFTFHIRNIASEASAEISSLEVKLDENELILNYVLPIVLEAGSYESYKETAEIDICSGEFFSASLKVLADTVGGTGNCNGETDQQWTSAHTSPPTLPPTNHPTKFPSNSPSEMCNISAEVICQVDGSGCDNFLISHTKCKDTEVVYTFKICNEDTDDPMDITAAGAKVGGKPINLPFDFSYDLAPNTCISVSETKTLNICDGIIPWVIFWVRAASSTGMVCIDNESHVYTTKTPNPTKSPSYPPSPSPSYSPSAKPTKSPSEAPSKTPTYSPSHPPSPQPSYPPSAKPTKSPSEVPSKAPTYPPSHPPSPQPSSSPTYACDVGLNLSCFGEADGEIGSGNFEVPCAKLLANSEQCERILRYQYTIANLSNGKVSIFGLEISRGSTSQEVELEVDLFKGQRHREIEDVVTNFCKDGGKVVKTASQISAKTFNAGNFCDAKAEYTFIPPAPPCQLQMDELTCTIDDNSGTSCQDYVNTFPTDDQCIVDVIYGYGVKSTGLGCTFIKKVTGSINGGEPTKLPLRGFSWQDKNLCKNESITFTQKAYSVNLCYYAATQIEQTFAISVNDGVDGYCTAFGYYTLDNEKFESETPTYAPTYAPSYIDNCDVTLALICKGMVDGKSGYKTPCKKLRASSKNCIGSVQYKYIVRNTADRMTSIVGLETQVHGDDTIDLLNGVTKLEPNKILVRTKEEEIDFCSDGGKLMKTTAVAHAETTMSTCGDNKEFKFKIPSPSCQLEMIESKCYINGDPFISCQEHVNNISIIDECRVNVRFEFTVKNVGIGSVRLKQAKGSINGGVKKWISLNHLTWKERNLLVNDEVTLIQKSDLNICEFVGKGFQFDVEINRGRSSCNVDGEYILNNPPTLSPTIPDTCELEMDLVCKTPDDKECILPSRQECTFRPTYFEMIFSGGNCASSDNAQGDDKFICSDVGDISLLSTAKIIATSKKGSIIYNNNIMKGQTFRIGTGERFDADTNIFIYDSDDNIIQEFTFHTSCSQNLSTNDKFGAITISGFGDDDQYVTGKYESLIVGYEVSNKGKSDISLRSLELSIGDEQRQIDFQSIIISANGNAYTNTYLIPESSLLGLESLHITAKVYGRSIRNEDNSCVAEQSIAIKN